MLSLSSLELFLLVEDEFTLCILFVWKAHERRLLVCYATKPAGQILYMYSSVLISSPHQIIKELPILLYVLVIK